LRQGKGVNSFDLVCEGILEFLCDNNAREKSADLSLN
jgi:hypothetical protein